MTKVDFYILKNGSTDHTACKLVEKAYSLGHRVYVHTDSENQAKQIDDMLWTYRAGSFVPHQRLQSGDEKESPVLIGHQGSPEVDCDVLINLAQEVPLFFSRFERVAELIGSDEENRQQGRQRYRFYKDRGYPLDTHDL
jgi:DNA polymerase-3 subunit chi